MTKQGNLEEDNMDDSQDNSQYENLTLDGLLMNDSMTETGEKETEKTSKQKPMKVKSWDLFIAVLKIRKEKGKVAKVPVNKTVQTSKYGEVKFGKLCAEYRHAFKQKKRNKKADRKLSQQMIEQAQAFGFDFEWDEEKDKVKQEKAALLEAQRFFENFGKVRAFYKANGHHFIPDDQPEAEWWKKVKKLAYENNLPESKRRCLEGIPLFTKKHAKGFDKFLIEREKIDTLGPDHKVRKWREEVTDLARKGAFSEDQIDLYVYHQVFKREDLPTNNGRYTSHCQDNLEVSQESSQRSMTMENITIPSQTMNQGSISTLTNEGSASTNSASSQSNGGSGMDEITVPPQGNQGPNSNPTNEGSLSTSASSQSNTPLGNQGPYSNPTNEGFLSTSASLQSNGGSGMDEFPVPALPNSSTGKKLPELKNDGSSGFPRASCDYCHNKSIPTQHYCMKNVSQGALFVYRGPDGNEPEKEICGKAICCQCRLAAGIEGSICPTCFLAKESQAELEAMKISELRDLARKVGLEGHNNIDKSRTQTLVPALCNMFRIAYKKPPKRAKLNSKP